MSLSWQAHAYSGDGAGARATQKNRPGYRSASERRGGRTGGQAGREAGGWVDLHSLQLLVRHALKIHLEELLRDFVEKLGAVRQLLRQTELCTHEATAAVNQR